MSILLSELVTYTDALLGAGAVPDYCPNGLQVEGGREVRRIVTGVTACADLIDAAMEFKADAIIAHHGYFWKGEDPVITGIKAARIRKLLRNDISLLAYHLPLDMHNELGNNVQLAKVLGLKITGGLDDAQSPLGLVGEIECEESAQSLAGKFGKLLNRQVLAVGNLERPIRRLAWCTGAAQSYIEKAAAKGVDCYISGEISEQTVHIAKECGIVYLSCGHHATERYGIKALGEHLAGIFKLDCQFVDIANPV